MPFSHSVGRVVGGVVVPEGLVPLVGGVVLLRLSASLFVPLQTEIQNRHVKAADRATVLSIYAVLSEGTGIATNLLFGAAAQAALPAAMFCGAGMCALGAVFFLIWHRTAK